MKTKWRKVGHRLEMSADDSVLRQERDLSDFIGTDEIRKVWGMFQFHHDEKYWYFCQKPYLIYMLEDIYKEKFV